MGITRELFEATEGTLRFRGGYCGGPQCTLWFQGCCGIIRRGSQSCHGVVRGVTRGKVIALWGPGGPTMDPGTLVFSRGHDGFQDSVAGFRTVL